MLKKNIDMICVTATCSDQKTIDDHIDSLNWGLDCEKHIVIVDDGGNLSINKKNTTVIRPKGKIHLASKVGFKVNEGISWAIENFNFKVSMALDDDALILRKGLEKWIFKIFENKDIGIVGVKDCRIANKNYSKPASKELCINELNKLADISNLRFPEEYVFYAVNFQPFHVLKELYEKDLLSYERENWPLPCESYQTIITNLIGYNAYFVGQYPNELEPPMYVMHHGSVLPPDPRSIDKNFLIHHSIKKVKNTKEWEIRNYYKKIREERKWML